MTRGTSGVLPRPTSRDDEAYLDFVETFKLFAMGQLSPGLQAAVQQGVSANFPDAEPSSLRIQDIRAAVDPLPAARSFKRLMRSHQEMMWRRTRDSFARVGAEHLKALEEAENQGPGRLVVDPEFEVPKYATREIHLQPGGYTDDELGGITFHYGTKVFYLGSNDQDELHNQLAENTAIPDDGQVRRVLDIGCSIGQATTALKKRFPDAEVWGLDVGLPLVRYAHKRAVDAGVDVNFKHGLAEDTGFEDESIDAVLAFILFHEVPRRIAKEIVEETFRTLRPGGKFTVFDFKNEGGNTSPGFRYIVDFDSRDNCEPYSPGFVATDFRQLLRDTGFEVADGIPTDHLYGNFLQAIVATKPL